ncbi:hypothetical protein G6F56_010994 [Rhizopus delemar]|nr:hypothetical protein G6F56_010994 [Rhizopus delemar]
MSGSQLRSYVQKNKQSVNSFFESARRRRDRSRAPPAVRDAFAKKSRNNSRSQRLFERRRATHNKTRETRDLKGFTKEEADQLINADYMSDEEDSDLPHTIGVLRPIWRSDVCNDFYEEIDKERKKAHNGCSKDRSITIVQYVLPEAILRTLPERAIAPQFRSSC